MPPEKGLRRRTDDPLHYGDPRCAGMTAILLCRKSTATEGRSKSVDEQLEIPREEAQRFGFGRTVEILEREGDHGEWWWRDARGVNPGPWREGLTEVVRLVEAGEAQAVLVYKTNRLVRDSGLNDALAKLFRKHKVRFVSGGRDREIDTAKGLCDNAIDAARAREWRDAISEDVLRDKDYKFRARMFTRDPSCFGMASKGRGSQAVEFHRGRLTVVRQIFDMFVGVGGPELGPHQIAQRLMDEGIPLSVGARGHKVRDARVVLATQVANILDNPQYAAMWEHGGVRAHYPRLLVPPEDGAGEPAPAVPVELWEAARRKRTGRTRCGGKAATSDRLLAGLVVCGACGRNLHVNVKRYADGTRLERWVCPHRTGRTRSCFGASYASVVVEELDRWAEDFLAPMVALELDELRAEREGGPLAREAEALEAQLEAARRDEATALRRAISLDEAQFEALARDLREEREGVERRLREARALLAEDGAIGTADTGLLRSNEQGDLKAGFARAIRWVALTKKGAVACPATGWLTAGRFRERDRAAYSTADNRRAVLPPDVDSASECPVWFGDPGTFVKGRRWALGAAGAGLDDGEILPLGE